MACCPAPPVVPSPDVALPSRRYDSSPSTQSLSPAAASSHRQAGARSEATTISRLFQQHDTLPARRLEYAQLPKPHSPSSCSFQLCAPRRRACNQNGRIATTVHPLLPKPSDPCAACFQSAQSPPPCLRQLPSPHTGLPLVPPSVRSASDARRR